MSTALAEKPMADVLPHEAGAASLIDGHYAPPPTDGDGKIWVRTSALIQAEAQKLYEMWSDVEAAPEWHERIVSVRRTGPNTAHWVMKSSEDADAKVLEWDFEIIADEPARRIVWRSVSGEPSNAGEVIFEPAPGGRGTMVTLLEQYRMGKLAATWEAITGRGPRQSSIENLRHFKALAETGEVPRSQSSPHAERGIIAQLKRATYGETIATPPHTAVPTK